MIWENSPGFFFLVEIFLTWILMKVYSNDEPLKTSADLVQPMCTHLGVCLETDGSTPQGSNNWVPRLLSVSLYLLDTAGHFCVKGA